MPHTGSSTGLTQQIGSFDYGQHVIVDTLQQIGHTFELSPDDYNQLVQDYRQTSIPADQWLFIELQVDEQDFVIGWNLISLPYSLEYATELYGSTYRTDLLFELFRFIGQLTSKSLQSFMWSVLSNPKVARAFVSIPASRSHHHAYPSGLLEHSMECLRIVQAGLKSLSHLSQREKDLTEVAALLHDIGKTQTLKANGDHTLEGLNVNHECYTLSVIVYELAQLKKTYEQAAVALEYMLTWKMSDGYPRFIGANLIKSADRTSTAAQLREKAFAELPSYYHYAQVRAGTGSIALSRLN